MYSGSPILFCTVHFQEFIIVGQKFYLIFRKRFLFAAAFKVQYLNLFCQTFSSRMAYSQWVGIWKKNCRNFIFLNSCENDIFWVGYKLHMIVLYGTWEYLGNLFCSWDYKGWHFQHILICKLAFAQNIVHVQASHSWKKKYQNCF